MGTDALGRSAVISCGFPQHRFVVNIMFIPSAGCSPVFVAAFLGSVHTNWRFNYFLCRTAIRSCGIFRDAVDALSAEIKSLLAGPLKGKRTGVGELRKKMEAQSDVQVSYIHRFDCRRRSWVRLGCSRRSLSPVQLQETTNAPSSAGKIPFAQLPRGKNTENYPQVPAAKYSGKTSKRKA